MFFLPKLELLAQTEKTTGEFSGLDLRPGTPESALTDCVNISPSGFPVLSVCAPWEKEAAPAAVTDAFGIGSGGMIEVLGSSPVKVRWRTQKPDGTPKAVTITLAAGDSLAAAESYTGGLVLLTKTGSGWRLCRYDADGSKKEETDMSALLGGTNTFISGMIAFERRLMILYNDYFRISYYDSLNQSDQYLTDGKLGPFVAQQYLLEDGGYFTGCVNYKSQPVLFKRDSMHLLQNRFSPYGLVKAADVGCINPRSIAVVNGVLYFLSQNGIMAYNGSLPRLVSACCPSFPEELKDSGACACGGCYYIGGYAYDPEKESWSRIRRSEPERQVSAVGSYNGAVFYRVVTAEGSALYRYAPDSFDAALEPEAWSFTTRRFHENESRRKKLIKLAFRIEPQQAAYFAVLISADGGDWQTVYAGETTGDEAREVVLKLPPCQDIRFRVSGKGRVNIPYLRRIYRVIPDGKYHPVL